MSSDVPIDHLDYGYIGKLTNPTEIEKILRVLRSKSEGYYPDLIQFTENKLQTLKPNSKLLIKSQKVKRANELPRDEWKELKSDLDQWEAVMTKRDSHLSSNNDENGTVLPPVRSPVTIKPEKKKNDDNIQSSGTKPIKSTDFASWDKYDAEKASDLVQKKDKKEKPALTKEVPPLELSGVTLNESEREDYAIKEREKGNEEFRAGDYEKALAYYTRSIEYLPSVAAYNNKALTYYKLERYSEAVSSCLEVLKLEPKNTKALIRRANAYVSLKQYSSALADVDTVLKLEPGNKKAQEIKTKLEANHPTEVKKGRRLVIEEVENPDETEKTSDIHVAKDQIPSSVESAPLPAPVPLPSHIQTQKEKGNSLFKCGQYGEALDCYTKCIKLLKNEKEDHTSSLATLLSNRAACHFKNGDCRSCIDDATHSIELSPVNLKSFMRRAQAYETMEKYKQAFCDYQIALKIDSRVDKAREASSRISVLLRDAHGNNWRNLLPASTDIERVTAAMSSSSPVYFQQHANLEASPPSSTSHSVDTMKDFTDSKTKGNTLVKEGNYAAASRCYTCCISLCPSEVAPYTNRALCFLKLNDFVSAESDCSMALELEPDNVKALYRRALARKKLKKLNEALKDLRTLIGLDPTNAAAVKEEKLVYDLYLKELRGLQSSTAETKHKSSTGQKSASSSNDMPPPVDRPKKRKVVIEEVNEETSTERTNTDNTAVDSTTPDPPIVKESVSSIREEKLSINQYIQLWNTLSKSSSSYDYAVILMKIPSSRLPQVITNKLEGQSLSGMISAIEKLLLNEGLYQKALSILSSLVEVQRFSTILMFLHAEDKQSLKKIFSTLEDSGSSSLTELKRSYSIK